MSTSTFCLRQRWNLPEVACFSPAFPLTTCGANTSASRSSRRPRFAAPTTASTPAAHVSSQRRCIGLRGGGSGTGGLVCAAGCSDVATSTMRGSAN
jgi:hypothetical protein